MNLDGTSVASSSSFPIAVEQQLVKASGDAVPLLTHRDAGGRCEIPSVHSGTCIVGAPTKTSESGAAAHKCSTFEAPGSDSQMSTRGPAPELGALQEARGVKRLAVAPEAFALPLPRWVAGRFSPKSPARRWRSLSGSPLTKRRRLRQKTPASAVAALIGRAGSPNRTPTPTQHSHGTSESPEIAERRRLRRALGHTLRPRELGQHVAVVGDGWGGSLTDGGYEAVVTEADKYTFTVARIGGKEPWMETHVLKEWCIPVGTPGTAASSKTPPRTAGRELRSGLLSRPPKRTRRGRGRPRTKF